MTNYEIDQALIQAQFEKIALLERELAEAQRVRDAAVAANTAEFDGHKLSIADHRKQMAEIKPKAEALDALAAWMQRDGTWVSLWPDHIQLWRGKYKFTGGTEKGLAAAIMDALEKAKR